MMYSAVWDYFMRFSGCFRLLQHSLQLKTTCSTNPACSLSLMSYCSTTPAQASLLILRWCCHHVYCCLFIFFQPLFILKLSSMPAVLLASKQAFPCLVLQELPSLYFHLKLQVALCTLCAQCRKQQAEGEAFLVPGGVLHAHTVELEGRRDKSNHCCWSQIPGCE